MTGETIISIAYGIDVLPKGDPYVSAVRQVVDSIAIAAVPGAFLVDAIPVLKHVPDWMPFAGFKRKAKEWKKIALMAADMPFEATKQNIVGSRSISTYRALANPRLRKMGARLCHLCLIV